MFYPKPCTTLDGTSSCGLASKHYPRERDETGVGSTSNGL